MPSTGIINKSYVSAIDPILDTREINKHVTDIYNENGLIDILNLAERKKPTKQPIYYTFVNESVFQLLDTTGATPSGSGTVQVTTTVTAASSGFNRVDDLVLFTNGNTGIITSVVNSSGIDTIVMKSVSGANLTLTAGDKLSSYSVAVGENSTSRVNIRFGLTRYSNKYQIFKETSQITDVQNASTIEVEFEGQPKFIVKDHIDKTVKLKGMINAAFIAGDMSNTSYSDTNPYLVDSVTGGSSISGTGAIQTTRGINKYIQLYGTNLNTGGGAYTLTALEDALDNLTAARAPLEYEVIGGKKARRIVDTMIKNLGSSGITSVRLVIDGKELDTEVSKFVHGGYTLNFMTMPILDHPTLLSQTSIAKSLYFVPMNNQVKIEGGGYEPAIQVRYTPSQSPYGNDMIGETHYGALNIVNPNGQGQFMGTDWTTTQGLECLGVQHYLKQQVF